MNPLATFLCEIFDDASLRRFVSAGEQGEAIAVQLPGAGASLASLANASARQICQRGLVAATVKRLHAEFPNRSPDIARLAAEDAGDPARRRRSPRTVGLLLVGNGLLALAMLTAEFSLDFAITPPDLPPLAFAADGLFAITLGAWLIHDDGPRAVTIAALYLLTWAVGWAVYAFASDQAALGLGPVLFAAPSLVLLGRRSTGKLGRTLVAFPLVLYFTFGAATLCWLLAGFSPNTALVVQDGDPVRSHYVTDGRGHRIDLPFGGWVRASAGADARLGRDLVLAVAHPPSGSVVSVFDITRPGGTQDIDQCVDALFGHLTAHGEHWELISRQPLASAPNEGRLLRFRLAEKGLMFEGWMVVRTANDRVYQVNAYGWDWQFPAVEQSLRGIVESFR